MGTWEAVRNRLDALNIDKGIFDSDNDYGFPIIEKQDFEVNKLIPFGTNKKRDGTSHMFLDDYRIERLWNKPKRYLDMLKKYDGTLSPDFSLYSDFPIAVQIWNTYRNRWLGKYWQTNGIKVIPTIVWGDKRSYDFCFEGVEEGSTVAVSSVGVMFWKESISLFQDGYYEMMDTIKPKKILFYGNPIDDLEGDIQFFNSFTDERFGNGRK
jgi:hypothetical protein